jgi:hypothetical protein
MGDNFYMGRGEYDSSEWWNFHSLDNYKKPSKEMTSPKDALWNKW